VSDFDKTQTLAWLRANTPVTDDANAEWCVALWFTANLHELTHKEMAESLLDGYLTIGKAWESVHEAIWQDGEEDFVAETFASYFS